MLDEVLHIGKWMHVVQLLLNTQISPALLLSTLVRKYDIFSPISWIAVYLHAYSISILTGNEKRCGQVPLVSIRGSPCLQQSNAAFCVPVLHSTEQRGLTLAVCYIDRWAVLQQQCHAVCLMICRNRDKLKTSLLGSIIIIQLLDCR
jgi:hypothetical protein